MDLLWHKLKCEEQQQQKKLSPIAKNFNTRELESNIFESLHEALKLLELKRANECVEKTQTHKSIFYKYNINYYDMKSIRRGVIYGVDDDENEE